MKSVDYRSERRREWEWHHSYLTIPSCHYHHRPITNGKHNRDDWTRVAMLTTRSRSPRRINNTCKCNISNNHFTINNRRLINRTNNSSYNFNNNTNLRLIVTLFNNNSNKFPSPLVLLTRARPFFKLTLRLMNSAGCNMFEHMSYYHILIIAHRLHRKMAVVILRPTLVRICPHR